MFVLLVCLFDFGCSRGGSKNVSKKAALFPPPGAFLAAADLYWGQEFRMTIHD